MDAITPQSMDCTTAVIQGSKNFSMMRPLLEVSMLSLSKKGHCLAAPPLHFVNLCLSGKPILLEQNACGTNFQKALNSPMLLPCSNMGRNAVYFGAL
jgi:hypothetical protein